MITEKKEHGEPNPWYWNKPEDDSNIEDYEAVFYQQVKAYRQKVYRFKKYVTGLS